ncbi:MAG: hypothetical protein U0Z53_03300 [Blastocatellia bacterium]
MRSTVVRYSTGSVSDRMQPKQVADEHPVADALWHEVRASG